MLRFNFKETSKTNLKKSKVWSNYDNKQEYTGYDVFNKIFL